MEKNIAIIGGGNLGSAIAKGIVEGKIVEPSQVTITRRKAGLLDDLKNAHINVSSDNVQAVENADIVILAVQPKQLDAILLEIKDAIKSKHVIVSVITGVSIADLKNKIEEECSIIRAMPNTAIAIKKSMTCLAAENVKDDVLDEVKKIFDTVGKTLVINENLMQAATVLGACGIAFFLRFIRAASQGGIEVGFHAEEAQLIAAQTALGAASLLLETNIHPENAIDAVTTPQGCTIAGLNEMEHNGLSSALIKGIVTSYKKIEHIK